MPNCYGYADNVSPTGWGTSNITLARQILTDAGYTNVAPGQRLTDPHGARVGTLRFSFSQDDPAQDHRHPGPSLGSGAADRTVWS